MLAVCERCRDRPTYGLREENKRLRCADHRLPGDFYFRNQNICETKNCVRWARWGLRGGRIRRCKIHRNKSIHILHDRWCHYPECTEHRPRGLAKFCDKHFGLPLPADYLDKLEAAGIRYSGIRYIKPGLLETGVLASSIRRVRRLLEDDEAKIEPPIKYNHESYVQDELDSVLSSPSKEMCIHDLEVILDRHGYAIKNT